MCHHKGIRYGPHGSGTCRRATFEESSERTRTVLMGYAEGLTARSAPRYMCRAVRWGAPSGADGQMLMRPVRVRAPACVQGEPVWGDKRGTGSLSMRRMVLRVACVVRGLTYRENGCCKEWVTSLWGVVCDKRSCRVDRTLVLPNCQHRGTHTCLIEKYQCSR